MKPSSVLFAATLVLSIGEACQGETKLMETNCVLETKVAAQRVRRGQDVDVVVQLRNAGPGDAWVNRRMLLNIAQSPAVMREIWLDVVGPDGEQIPFSAHVRAGEARASDFGLLKPGQSVSRPIKLSNSYDFEKPGTYRITAHYRDGTTDIPKAPPGVPHLGIEIRSAPATFELIAP